MQKWPLSSKVKAFLLSKGHTHTQLKRGFLCMSKGFKIASVFLRKINMHHLCSLRKRLQCQKWKMLTCTWTVNRTMNRPY